jgi:peptide/nickel transport system substrate-binding protein
MRDSGTFFAGLTIVAVIMAASSAAAENVLHFTGLSGGAVTIDPHAYVSSHNKVATEQVYEALLDIDSNLAIVPQLALAWSLSDPTTWEFQLRPSVTFHDGTPFTAADVVFSIERARTKTSDLRDYLDGMAGVEAVGDHTVRITTATPDPSLWLKLADVAIMSRAWAERHEVTTPADYNRAREENYASRHANGTGPFIIEAFEPRGRYVLVRNPAWWGAAEYPHNIDRVVHIWKEAGAEKLAALLEGKIDLLLAPPYWALDQIRRTPGLKLAHRPALLTAFFGLDQGSPELRSSNVNRRNPFEDRRVRQAMSHAIAIKPILGDLMGELLAPAGMLVAPGVNGYIAELDQPPTHDPERARALLAEAGYPDGFSVTLDCPSEYGDAHIATCRGAAEQLGAVGIEVSVNLLATNALDAKLYKDRESDFFYEVWPMDPDPERVLREWFGQNIWNVSGYVNPRVDELIEKIKTEMVTYARDSYLEEAWRIVTEDLVYLPVRHDVSVFAMRDNLEIPPDPWNVPRFRLARFKTSKVN